MNQKKLAFGLMRLPQKETGGRMAPDPEAVKPMVDRFLAAGFTHFDTAYPYHSGLSEGIFRECVAERYPREAYTITDKLSFFAVKEGETLEEYFAGQLERSGVDYFDYYWLHAMDGERLSYAEELGAFAFLLRKKEEGRIRHIGMSFHDKAEVLETILTRHPEMEYVQLQLNYLDWEDPEVQARQCYEACVRHGKPVMVMEPVKGGLLANIPEEAERLLRQADPAASAASWAIRFAASLDNVCMVLSGMSTLEQVEDNVGFMEDLRPLGEEERAVLRQVVEIIHAKTAVACTACRYCVDGCPRQIPIPDIFKIYNNACKFGEAHLPQARQRYAQRTGGERGKASDCIRCGQCEEKCPQRLPVIRHLADAAGMLE